jgi:hypothetical protein
MTQELSNPEASIESLTRNLLECYEELDLIYRVAARIMDSGDILSQLESILTEAATILRTPHPPSEISPRDARPRAWSGNSSGRPCIPEGP